MLIRLIIAFVFFFSGFFVVDLIKGDGIKLIDIIGSAVIFAIVFEVGLSLLGSSKKKKKKDIYNK